MKTKGGKKTKPQRYAHIASAIIPPASVVAVPSAAPYLFQQKVRASDEWGSLASTLHNAAVANQLLIPSASVADGGSHHREQQQRPAPRTTTGRMDASTDEDDSDEEEERRRQRDSARRSPGKDIASQSPGRSSGQTRLSRRASDDEESIGTAARNAKEALTAELTRSVDERSGRRTPLTSPRQQVPPLVLNPIQSQTGPTSGRSVSGAGGVNAESRSINTARSSLNDTTTVPVSARSVKFKEPVVDEHDTSASEDSATVLSTRRKSALDHIVLSPPEDYQQNLNDLERRNQSLNSEVQQLRSNNRNLQRQHQDLLDRMQTSPNLPRNELDDLLKQSGRDQTKGLEDLNSTLQDRCDQLQNDLSAMKDRYNQSQNQSIIQKLKTENHQLQKQVRLVNAALSANQTKDPPKVLKKDMDKKQRQMVGLPADGPTPIWLLNHKFLAPLLLHYEEQKFEKDEFIRKLQTQLNEVYEQVKLITNENVSLHERLSRSSISGKVDTQLTDIEHIKRQAYLVLEENKVLQEQLDVQTNRLTDVQKTQIQEVSGLTRRLLIVESEKTESGRVLETIRLRNDDLKRKYEQLMLDNNHRIHIQEHMQEITEMKRLTDDLSENHAHEMQLLLRRVQDAEAAKRTLHLKLTEHRSDVERLKGEIKVLKKSNRKLQLRVQTFEKKLELQQVKEQRITTMFETTSKELEDFRTERETYMAFAKAKDDELNKTRTLLKDEAEKITELEERLENYKSKTKERNNDNQDQLKRQHDNLKLDYLHLEQRIQQLQSMLNEKQMLVDDLHAEKRTLEVDLETIWQANNADNLRRREQLFDMRITS